MRWRTCGGSRTPACRAGGTTRGFKALAEELGVTVTKDPGIGWSPTTLAAATVERSGPTILARTAALRLYRSAEIAAGGSRMPSPPACVCSCWRRIRVAPSVLEAGPITCGVCGADFEPEDR